MPWDAGLSALFKQILLASALLLANLTAAAGQERRVALVIGVSHYEAVNTLQNTLNDARGMASALGRLGFDVDTVLDPNRTVLESAVQRFGTRATSADVALFYYAGHAVQAAERNWLLPVSAKVAAARDLPLNGMELDTVMAQLDGVRLSIFILDSCRDNPFNKRLASGRGIGPGGGLAQVQAPIGTLVAFSTAPGSTASDGAGPNSPFTGALLKRIETPGLEITQLLNLVRGDVKTGTKGAQVPWDQSSMEGVFYLKPDLTTSPTAPSSPPRTSTGREIEAVFWESVRQTKNPAELQAYLTRFPDGTFSELARIRLADMSRAATAKEGETLLERLTAGMPGVPASSRRSVAEAYANDLKGSKALAISLEGHSSWRTDEWSTPAIAQEKALEGCQVRFGAPCVLFASDQVVFAPSPSGEWARHDMPKTHYAGVFDPIQIPAIGEATRSGLTVSLYTSSSPPRALALHPWGRIFAVVGASSQTAAEKQALDRCNDDADRKGQDGPCFLYATSDQVVLQQRFTRPVDDAYSKIMAAEMLVNPRSTVWSYAGLRDHKALALDLASGETFNWSGVDTQPLAAQLALEGCQQQSNRPCVLLASGSDLVVADPRKASPQDMARLHYSGAYDPANVPFLRLTDELRGYGALPEPKAIAVRPQKARVVVIKAAASVADAEAKALARCNADPSPFPCFLYAVGNQVVLSKRQTEPSP